MSAAGELTTEQRLVFLEQRVNRLEDMLAQFLSGGNGAKPEVARLWWPSSYRPAAITQFFGENYSNYIQYGLAGHEGLDIRTGVDGKVICIADGVVSQVDEWPNKGAYGYSIRVKHEALGFESIYGHLNPSVSVPKVGTVLAGGAILGKAGSTGNSKAIHLHLSIKRSLREFLDPITFLMDAYHEAGGTQILPAPKGPIVIGAR